MLNLKSISKHTLPLMIAVSFFSCKNVNSSDSELFKVGDKKITKDLNSEIKTSADACNYLKTNNYFPSNKSPEGTEIFFSAGEGKGSQNSNRAEDGQTHGVVGKNGNFVKKDNVTKQALYCPGSFKRVDNSGITNIDKECLWPINGDRGYNQFAFDIVCNKVADPSGAALNPSFKSMKVNQVAINDAGTAGKTADFADAVEFKFTGPKGEESYVTFAKDFGLVSTEYYSVDGGGLVPGVAKYYAKPKK